MVDMSVSGKGPAFSFSRAYNSKQRTPWSFAYEMKASFMDAYSRTIAIGPREDGHMQYFFKDMVDKWHTLNPGDYDKLIEDSSTHDFTLYTQGNRLYKFTDPNRTVATASGATAGQLLTIEDRLGQALTFNYLSNKLKTVVDANNRVYTIQRDGNNRIERVTDFSGRYVGYHYDVNNNMLTEVRKMRGDAFKERYNYSNTTYLKDIIDPRANRQLTVQYFASGRVSKLIDGNNQETGFNYGKSTKVGEYTGITQVEVDTLNHDRAYILNADRTRVDKVYDAQSYSEAMTDGTLRTYKTAKDNTHFADLGLVTETIDPKNNITAIVYDESTNASGNKPQTITDAKTQITQATYATVPNQLNLTPVTALTKKAKVTGDVDITTQYTNFTATGKASKITDAEGHLSARTFNLSTGDLTQATNARTNVTNYSYDGYGNVTQVSQVASTGNIVTTREYDNNNAPAQLGRLKTETSPLGLVTTYTYDAHGNVLTRNESKSGTSINYTTQYSYDASDNLTQTTDPKCNVTSYSYDNLNRKVQESYQVTINGALQTLTKQYVYDALGRLKTITNERNQSSHTHYTARSQVDHKINPLGKIVVTYTYDKNGNVKTVTDAEGRLTTTTYDALNRKIKVQVQVQVQDLKVYQTWEYNTAGQVKRYMDRQGEYTVYEYDRVGNLTKLTDAEGGITRSSYDANGNVLTVTDPKQHTTTYTYDQLDRRTKTTLHNGQYWTYSYDVNGNVLQEITPAGESTVSTYDALNRVTQLTEKAANGSITRQISYSYDENSNVISETDISSAAVGSGAIGYTYDEINRINSVTDQFGKTIQYAYDKAGNRTGLTYPGAGNKTITYAYDNADRLKSITDWLNKTTSYTKNEAGQTTQINYGNGAQVNYSYDTIGRLILLENLSANGAVISRHDMTLDKRGNITEANVTLPLAATMPESISAMTYDENNRIKTADGQAFTHDSAGRMTADGFEYIFNQNDLLTNVVMSGGASLKTYQYDLNNNRISQTGNDGTETRYVIDQLASLPNVVAETNSSGTVSHYYIYGEGLVSQIDAAGNSHYYHYDPTGSTLALTNVTGSVTDKYSYSPYGMTTSDGSTPNPFKYIGKHCVMDDSDGTFLLHYMRARYYKPDTKRFISLDALHGGILNPQALNRYAYVLGNPVMGVDPSGYYTWRQALIDSLEFIEGDVGTTARVVTKTLYGNIKASGTALGDDISKAIDMDNVSDGLNAVSLSLAINVGGGMMDALNHAAYSQYAAEAIIDELQGVSDEEKNELKSVNRLVFLIVSARGIVKESAKLVRKGKKSISDIARARKAIRTLTSKYGTKATSKYKGVFNIWVDVSTSAGQNIEKVAGLLGVQAVSLIKDINGLIKELTATAY